MAKTIYYQEKRFNNDVNGNPRKVLVTFEETSDGNLYEDKIKTYQYDDSSRILKKMYEGEDVKFKKINGGDFDNFSEAKQRQKYREEFIS